MTKEEDIWLCSECNQLKGRHDMWFENDLCEECNTINENELKKRIIMKLEYSNMIKEKRQEILNQINNFLPNGTIVFNRAFTIYLTDDDGNGSYVKNPYTIKLLEDSRILIGEDNQGRDFETDVKFIDDIVYLAYIVDILNDGDFTID